MALILVSGLPCSGRTRRSKELVADFERRIEQSSASSTAAADLGGIKRVIRLTNAQANVRRTAFTTQLAEKPARAAFLSLAMRSIARDAIVICDGGAGLNIKGFRYQLWCAAREVGVRCVSVLCVARPETCKERNEKRKEKGTDANDEDEVAYDEMTINEMLMRFEEPNAMTRWDSPLFVLDCNEGKDDQDAWEAAPLDTIWEAVIRGELKRAPDVVAPVRATTSNYLSLLESSTQFVLSALQTLQNAGSIPEMGGQVVLPVTFSSNPQQTMIALTLPAGKRAPTTATLQRLRRQFVKMHASSAASQNEIGFVMEQEAKRIDDSANVDAGQQNQFRVQRKIQQHSNSGPQRAGGGNGASGTTQPRSAEEEIARRFIAFLEETL